MLGDAILVRPLVHEYPWTDWLDLAKMQDVYSICIRSILQIAIRITSGLHRSRPFHRYAISGACDYLQSGYKCSEADTS